MKNRNYAKKRTIILLIAVSLILTFFISLSMAWYVANRSASGSVIFDKGIFIDFENVDGEDRERNLVLTDGRLFDISVVPNQVIEIKNPYIKALENSVPFYLRAKLNYFSEKDGNLTAVTKDKLSEIVKLNPYGNAFDFNSKFLPDDTNEWFYFVKDESANLSSANLAVVNPNDVVNIFENSSMTIADFNCESGSPNEIDNLVIKLEIHALQVTETSSSDFGLGESESTSTTLSLNGGEVTYLTDDNAIEIVKFDGTDIVVDDDSLPITNKEITIADTAFDPLIIREDVPVLIYVYDSDLFSCFTNKVLNNEDFREKLIDKITIVTSKEIYELLDLPDGVMSELTTASLIMSEADL